MLVFANFGLFLSAPVSFLPVFCQLQSVTFVFFQLLLVSVCFRQLLLKVTSLSFSDTLNQFLVCFNQLYQLVPVSSSYFFSLSQFQPALVGFSQFLSVLFSLQSFLVSSSQFSLIFFQFLVVPFNFRQLLRLSLSFYFSQILCQFELFSLNFMPILISCISFYWFQLVPVSSSQQFFVHLSSCLSQKVTVASVNSVSSYQLFSVLAYLCQFLLDSLSRYYFHQFLVSLNKFLLFSTSSFSFQLYFFQFQQSLSSFCKFCQFPSVFVILCQFLSVSVNLL